MRKIAGDKGSAQHPHPCILEVSDQGIRMVDKSKPAVSVLPFPILKRKPVVYFAFFLFFFFLCILKDLVKNQI